MKITFDYDITFIKRRFGCLRWLFDVNELVVELDNLIRWLLDFPIERQNDVLGHPFVAPAHLVLGQDDVDGLLDVNEDFAVEFGRLAGVILSEDVGVVDGVGDDGDVGALKSILVDASSKRFPHERFLVENQVGAGDLLTHFVA